MFNLSVLLENAAKRYKSSPALTYGDHIRNNRIPKGACLSHLNLFLNAKVANELFQNKTHESVLAVLPLFHIFGMTTVMNASVYQGLNIVLLPRFDAEIYFELIVEHHISIFAGVPAMYWAMLNVVHDPLLEEIVRNNLRLCISGGALSRLKSFKTLKIFIKSPYWKATG